MSFSSPAIFKSGKFGTVARSYMQTPDQELKCIKEECTICVECSDLLTNQREKQRMVCGHYIHSSCKRKQTSTSEIIECCRCQHYTSEAKQQSKFTYI